MGKRAIAGGCVILERQSNALVREVIEPTVIHRLPDLALDQRLPNALAGWFGGVGALRIAFEPHRPSVAQARDRQADATRR